MSTIHNGAWIADLCSRFNRGVFEGFYSKNSTHTKKTQGVQQFQLSVSSKKSSFFYLSKSNRVNHQVTWEAWNSDILAGTSYALSLTVGNPPASNVIGPNQWKLLGLKNKICLWVGRINFVLAPIYMLNTYSNYIWIYINVYIYMYIQTTCFFIMCWPNFIPERLRSGMIFEYFFLVARNGIFFNAVCSSVYFDPKKTFMVNDVVFTLMSFSSPCLHTPSDVFECPNDLRFQVDGAAVALEGPALRSLKDLQVWSS